MPRNVVPVLREVGTDRNTETTESRNQHQLLQRKLFHLSPPIPIKMNKHCTCPLAGFCTRHKIEKSEAQFKICKGEATDRPDCSYKFWAAWETGKFGAVAQATPILDEWECESREATPPIRRSSGRKQASVRQLKASAKASTLCIYRGDEVRRVFCPTCCGGGVQVKVFSCEIHGECTIGKQIGDVKCCAGCLDCKVSES